MAAAAASKTPKPNGPGDKRAAKVPPSSGSAVTATGSGGDNETAGLAVASMSSGPKAKAPNAPARAPSAASAVPAAPAIAPTVEPTVAPIVTPAVAPTLAPADVSDSRPSTHSSPEQQQRGGRLRDKTLDTHASKISAPPSRESVAYGLTQGSAATRPAARLPGPAAEAVDSNLSTNPPPSRKSLASVVAQGGGAAATRPAAHHAGHSAAAGPPGPADAIRGPPAAAPGALHARKFTPEGWVQAEFASFHSTADRTRTKEDIKQLERAWQLRIDLDERQIEDMERDLLVKQDTYGHLSAGLAITSRELRQQFQLLEPLKQIAQEALTERDRCAAEMRRRTEELRAARADEASLFDEVKGLPAGAGVRRARTAADVDDYVTMIETEAETTVAGANASMLQVHVRLCRLLFVEPCVCAFACACVICVS